MTSDARYASPVATVDPEEVTRDTPPQGINDDLKRGVPLHSEPGVAPLRRPPASAATFQGHIPALDGIRAIAVLLVLARHSSATFDPTSGLATAIHRGMRTGWIGVDIFFALSGFLITGILIDTRGRPGFLRSFYARRSLRIFPLYYAFLALAFFVAPYTAIAGDQKFATLVDNQAWFWTYAVNVLIPLAGESAAPLHLSHLWSLAVEEQFYLFWPVVVLLVPARHLAKTCLALAGAAVALRLGLILQAGGGTDWAYMSMPARMDALLLGGLLAIAMRRSGWAELVRRYHRPAGLLAALVLAGLFIVRGGLPRNDPWVQLVGYLALSVGATSLIAATVMAPQEKAFVRGLVAAPLQLIGRYSYAIYVAQYPIILYLERSAARGPSASPWLAKSSGLAELSLFAVAAILSVLVSAVTWHLLEQPFLSLKRFFPRGDQVAGRPERQLAVKP